MAGTSRGVQSEHDPSQSREDRGEKRGKRTEGRAREELRGWGRQGSRGKV